MLKHKIQCPKCGKRAFDISALPQETIVVELKCPNCQNIVRVPCTKQMCIDAKTK